MTCLQFATKKKEGITSELMLNQLLFFFFTLLVEKCMQCSAVHANDPQLHFETTKATTKLAVTTKLRYLPWLNMLKHLIICGTVNNKPSTLNCPRYNGSEDSPLDFFFCHRPMKMIHNILYMLQYFLLHLSLTTLLIWFGSFQRSVTAVSSSES